ncbi:bifunctional pyrR domain protein [Mycobacterium kansasii 732]|nr:bifunctional pyrR domain protein [Mycobacterium kansasii 732]
MATASDAANGRELMSAADVGRTISRIAHQVIEKNCAR